MKSVPIPHQPPSDAHAVRSTDRRTVRLPRGGEKQLVVRQSGCRSTPQPGKSSVAARSRHSTTLSGPVETYQIPQSPQGGTDRRFGACVGCTDVHRIGCPESRVGLASVNSDQHRCSRHLALR